MPIYCPIQFMVVLDFTFVICTHSKWCQISKKINFTVITICIAVNVIKDAYNHIEYGGMQWFVIAVLGLG